MTSPGGGAPGHSDVALFGFRVADVALALPVSHVEAILDAETATPLPGAPPHLLGFVPFRESALPVIDLGRFLTRSAHTADPLLPDRILVVSARAGRAGLFCQQAFGVIAEPRTPESTERVVARRPPLSELATDEVESERGRFAVLDCERLLEAVRPSAVDGRTG